MPTLVTQPIHRHEPLGSTHTSPARSSAQHASHKPVSPYMRQVGLVHRIDVGIHTLATECLIIELRSMDAGELCTLYSWVGQLVDPAKVRALIPYPQALPWRNVRRSEQHGGESYARQHTLYVHIHAPFEARGNDVNTHAMVQSRFNEWLATDAVGEALTAT
jgi:hypothetical protein